ncbi:MAG: hypothetical protein AVDCRST_MAG38-1532, partial [uncultured Solirubrobacteraceae bacterium]
ALHRRQPRRSPAAAPAARAARVPGPALSRRPGAGRRCASRERRMEAVCRAGLRRPPGTAAAHRRADGPDRRADRLRPGGVRRRRRRARRRV